MSDRRAQRAIEHFADHFDTLERTLASQMDLRLDRIAIATALRFLLVDQCAATAAAAFNLEPLFYLKLTSAPIDFAHQGPLAFYCGTDRERTAPMRLLSFLNRVMLADGSVSLTVRNVIDAVAYADGTLHPKASRKYAHYEPLIEDHVKRQILWQLLVEIARITLDCTRDIRFLINGGKSSGDLSQPDPDLQPVFEGHSFGGVPHFFDGRHHLSAASLALNPGAVIFLLPCFPPFGIPHQFGTMLEFSSGFDDMPRLRLQYRTLGRVCWQLTRQRQEEPLLHVETSVPLNQIFALSASVGSNSEGTRLGISTQSSEPIYSSRLPLPDDMNPFILGKLTVGAGSRGRSGARWQSGMIAQSKPIPETEFENFARGMAKHGLEYMRKVHPGGWINNLREVKD